MNVIKSLLLFLSCMLLLSCGDKDNQSTAPDHAIQQKPKRSIDIKVTDPTVLRKELPANTMAYVRIPDMFGFMSAVKGDAFSEALSHKAHTDLINKLRSALGEKLFNRKDIFGDPLLMALLKYMRSPLEAAILPSSNQLPIPNSLITVKLDLSLEDFNNLIADVAGKSMNVHLRRPVSVDKPGIVMSGPVPVLMDYNESTRVLRVMAGLTVDEQVFSATLAGLKKTDQHAMYVDENRIDSSHHGLFVWVNMQQVLPVILGTMPPEKLQQLKTAGITTINSISLGWGVSNEKGRLKALLQMPRAGFREFVYPVVNNIQLQSAGAPKSFASLSFPSSSQMQELEKAFRQRAGEEPWADYVNAKNKFREKAGTSLEDLLKVFGPEIIFLADTTGEYIAVRLRDKADFKRLLDKIMSASGQKVSSRDYRGVEIHHISLPSIFSYKDKEKENSKPTNKVITDLLGKGKTHIYWIEEGDYLVTASLPQMLVDRNSYKEKSSVNQWLTERQKQDASSSLLMLSTSISGTHRKLYYTYMHLLMYLGDLAESDIDIYKLPTAMDLDFPATGTYGMQVDSSESSLGIEFVFENNPMEILIGQDMTSIAVVGILAAIAIPAYNDYKLRAQVAGAIILSMQERMAVEKFIAEKGTFPTAEDIKQFGLEQKTGEHTSDIWIIPGTGEIEIAISGSSSISGKNLVLVPLINDKEINWKCSGEIAPKYFPANCR